MSLVHQPETSNQRSSLIKSYNEKGALVQSVHVKRTSNLKSPIMLLSGQEAEILSCRFSPCGQFLASGSFDKTIFLWNVYGDCTNYNVIRGHNGAIIELDWSGDSEKIFTACSDKTVGIFDANSGQKIKKFKGHNNVINSMSVLKHGSSEGLVVSGGDDRVVNIWDARQKDAVWSVSQKYQVTSVSFNTVGDVVFAGGLDNDIIAWDVKNRNIQYKLQGHLDTITGVRLSPDGGYLLSNSMDNSLRIWDVKPFAVNNSRCLKIFEGSSHGFEKNLIRPGWSPDGLRIASGSADRTVMVWDVTTRRILYKLPGHKGCVNEVNFHPKEPIIASCSSDRQIYLGELEPSNMF